MVRIISICLAVTYNPNHSYTPLQKWIVRLLMPNRSLAHMPRIYKGLIRKDHQFLLHGPHQVDMLPPGKSVRPIEFWNSVSPLNKTPSDLT